MYNGDSSVDDINGNNSHCSESLDASTGVSSLIPPALCGRFSTSSRILFLFPLGSAPYHRRLPIVRCFVFLTVIGAGSAVLKLSASRYF